MYSTICVEWAGDHFGLGLTKLIHFLTNICAKNDFHIFVPSDFDRLNFRPQICFPSYSCPALCFH